MRIMVRLMLTDGRSVVDAAVEEIAALIHQQRRAAMQSRNRPDISMTHYHVLMMLDAEGTVPMHRVADMLVCSTPNATGIVDRMEERGFIERLRDDRDRRVVLVRLTDVGRQTLAAFETVKQNSLRRIIESMGPDDQETCLRAFRAMRHAAEGLAPLPSSQPTLQETR
jgi:MarR family transcriptional regulator, organic hydroperoxide resistance regulator